MLVDLLTRVLKTPKDVSTILRKMTDVYDGLSDQAFEALIEECAYELNPAPDVVLEFVVNGFYARWDVTGDYRLVFREASPEPR